MREAPHLVLGSFEGPLELLWYLIDRDKLDIYDIPIAHITDHYFRHLEALHWQEIDLAGDFLLVAAQLVQLKLRMLLPRPVLGEGEEETADPRQELVNRLLSYRAFQSLAGELSQRAAQQSAFFPGCRQLPSLTSVSPTDCDSQGLARLMSAIITRSIPRQASISRQAVTIGQCMRRLLVRLNNAWRRTQGGTSFAQLVGRASRSDWVINFVSLLELIRRKKVRAEQHEPLADIELYPYRSTKEASA